MHTIACTYPNVAARPMGPCLVQKMRPSTRAFAVKRPSQLLPPTEDKSVQCLVETGIRGSLAMLAATALHLDVFSHVHWQLDDILTGLQLAAPCLLLEGGLLLLHNTLTNVSSNIQELSPTTADSMVGTSINPATKQDQQQSDQAAMNAALLAAIDTVYLHNIRYSLIGATSPGSRLLLEAGSQVSEELLARGVLLGAASVWLTSRFIEAGMCGDQPLLALDPISSLSSSTSAATAAELLPCGTGPQWLAAAGLCAVMASRFVVHSRGKAAAARAERDAAAAEAAAKRAVLRYEPLAVQQAAAAASGHHVGSEIDAEAVALLAAAESEAIERLARGWLGARFVLGQACLFGAYIATDNLLASFAAGLALQVVSTACAEKYLQRVTS